MSSLNWLEDRSHLSVEKLADSDPQRAAVPGKIFTVEDKDDYESK